MELSVIQTAIEAGNTYLGIELGSTRVKGVLILPDGTPIASGGFSWENRLENGIWTYHQDEIWTALQSCYAALAADVREKYHLPLKTLGAFGISAMMHGYLPFDRTGRLLTAFRTWRNTITAPAAAELTQRFHFNIPQRWSIAHLYQAILNGESHVNDVAFLTTLSGYVHWRLTGRKVLGIGEASGMFPIDSAALDFDAQMLDQFQAAAASHGWRGTVRAVLPEVLCAGEEAGFLTEEGAKLLDPSGNLRAGIPAAPPEGDAGTGMTATNSVAERTGNVSAGTSIFSMVVLERPLRKVYEAIDLVTTPAGRPTAMVHCNNCTNEINAWAEVFGQMLEAMGCGADRNRLFQTMFRAAAEGEADCGGLVAYNYLSGEPVMGLAEGRPLLMRAPEARLTFPNFMRAQLYSAVAALKTGMDLLAEENVQIDRLYGHGGYFKTPEVGQRILAGALGVPVSVMETAGEGGAWGMALLAAYLREKAPEERLEDYLSERIFAGQTGTTLSPTREEQEGFQRFLRRCNAGLDAERAAIASI